MDNIDKTTEPQLRDFDAAGVIVGARIVKSDDGYVLVIQVSWKPGELVVFSQRGKHGSAASLHPRSHTHNQANRGGTGCRTGMGTL
jgi:hypothetical protein